MVWLALLMAPWLCSCRPQTAPPRPRVPQVTVVCPMVSNVTNWDEYPAHLEAVHTVEIRSRVAGHLESIHFRDGAEVRAGQLLFVIDPKPYEAELARAKADRRRAETQLELARNEFERAARLRESRAISEEEFDSRAKAVRAAEDSLEAAQAAEAIAALNLRYTRIVAPIEGQIGRRLVALGNMVQGSTMMPGTLLATLVSQDPVYAYFDVPDQVYRSYRGLLSGLSGSEEGAWVCEFGLSGEVGFPHQGRIDFVDNQADARTGTVRMRAILPNADRRLIPGFTGRLRLPVQCTESALLVPEAAILSEQTRKYVYVVNAEGIIEPRTVELGRSHGIQRVVQTGLKPEDWVVVTGLWMLRPGVKVEVVKPQATGTNGISASLGRAGTVPARRWMP